MSTLSTCVVVGQVESQVWGSESQRQVLYSTSRRVPMPMPSLAISSQRVMPTSGPIVSFRPADRPRPTAMHMKSRDPGHRSQAFLDDGTPNRETFSIRQREFRPNLPLATEHMRRWGGPNHHGMYTTPIFFVSQWVQHRA